MKKEEDILYVYATEDNEKYVSQVAGQYNLKKSFVVNKIIEAYRMNKRLKFEKYVPKYVQKANAWENKNKAE